MTQNIPTNTDQLKAENERLKLMLKSFEELPERWYETLFNESTQAFAVCETFSDFPATVLDCNTAFRSILKRSNQQIIGEDFMELMRKGEKRKFFVQTFGNTKEKNINDFPLVFIDGLGNEISLEISTSFFNSPQGRLALVSVQTVNPHKSIIQNGIEQLLSRSNQIFFGIKQDDILQFDYVSFSIFKVTGYSSDQLLLNPFLFWNNCHPEDIVKLKKAFQSENQFEDKLNIRFIRQDGQMIWLDFSIISCPIKDNNDACYYAVAREITTQKKKKRLQRKIEFYNQIVLQSAQSLIGRLDRKKFRSLANNIGKHMPGERFSIYVADNKQEAFSYTMFNDDISFNTQSYAASNERIWEELNDEFINLPVLLFQSGDDTFNAKTKPGLFFTHTKKKSALIIPLSHQGFIFGFVSSSTLVKPQLWDRTDINFLSQISQLISQAFYTNSVE